MSKRYRIGFALPAKKIPTFIQPSLLSHAADHSIDLIEIEPSKPLIPQGPFDAIVHKLYDQDWNSQLRQFSAQNPTTPIIDEPDSIAQLHDRSVMLEVVARLKIGGPRPETVDVPKQILASKPEDLSKANESLGFPALAKPIEANGSEKSHKMRLVFDDEGLTGVEPPVVLQEFVNHGGVIFKVYVAGDYVECVERKSLPNIPAGTLGGLLKGSLPFSQISNLPVKEEEGFAAAAAVEMPAKEFVDAVAKGLRLELGISLFNFDMIRDSNNPNRYLVIDINYFPGYAKMPNYEPAMTDFFLDVVGKKKQGNGNAI